MTRIEQLRSQLTRPLLQGVPTQMPPGMTGQQFIDQYWTPQEKEFLKALSSGEANFWELQPEEQMYWNHPNPDAWNDRLRNDPRYPEYQQFLRSMGADPDQPMQLSDEQRKKAKEFLHRTMGYQVGMEVDPAGNINQPEGFSKQFGKYVPYVVGGLAAGVAAPVIAGALAGGATAAPAAAGSIGSSGIGMGGAGLGGGAIGGGTAATGGLAGTAGALGSGGTLSGVLGAAPAYGWGAAAPAAGSAAGGFGGLAGGAGAALGGGGAATGGGIGMGLGSGLGGGSSAFGGATGATLSGAPATIGGGSGLSAAMGGTASTGGGLGGLTKFLNKDTLGAAAKAVGDTSQAAASNRGTAMDAELWAEQQSQQRLRDYYDASRAREEEGRAGLKDAWNNQLRADYVANRGDFTAPSYLAGYTDYSFVPKASTDAQKQAAAAMSAESMGRLQGGNPLAPIEKPDRFAFDPKNLQAGNIEKYSPWIAGGLSALGGYFGKR